MLMLFFWLVMPCGLVGRYQRLGGDQPWKWGRYFPPNRFHLPPSPHGVTTQKTNIDIMSSVRTSNLISKEIKPLKQVTNSRTKRKKETKNSKISNWIPKENTAPTWCHDLHWSAYEVNSIGWRLCITPHDY
jgi:hypothetical protein